jgi:hypothetical protein
MPHNESMSRRAPERASWTRKYVFGAVAGVLAVALAWVWWPSGDAGPTAPPQTEQRAQEIAEKLRQAEPAQPPPDAPRSPPPTGGPKNLRQRPPQ